jgi:hypothetical protein
MTVSPFASADHQSKQYRMVLLENFQAPILGFWPLEEQGEPTQESVDTYRHELNKSFTSGPRFSESQLAGRLINFRRVQVYERSGRLVAESVAPMFEVL